MARADTLFAPRDYTGWKLRKARTVEVRDMSSSSSVVDRTLFG